MSDFKDHFSSAADAYRAARPDYPAELFAWLAAQCPRRELAVDVGCGNGQASLALAEHFERVIALDPSAAQIAAAPQHPRVSFGVAPAEATGLADSCADLLLAAQALHWFDFARFWPEVRRVLRPGGLFAAITYSLCRIDPPVDRVVARLYRDLLGPCWPPERRHVDTDYASIAFPFPLLPTPDMAIRRHWTLAQLTDYFATWSAVKEYRKAHGHDPVEEVAGALAAAWGDPAAPKEVVWPLTVCAGRFT